MRVRLGRLLLCAAALALAGLGPAPADAARARYYLSLGDSLAQGMQPDAAGLTLNSNQGYADQLYAIEKRRLPGLELVKLGCGGETTTSFLTGQGNAGDALLLGCNPAGGSQMVAAERFLRQHHHRGEVALLTLDIGANDIDGCEAEESIDANCVIRGAGQISANLPVIMRRLRRAAAPGTPMAAMTLYDPFLQLYLTRAGRAEALASDEYARNVNEGLARLYRAGGFRVAHVDTAFRTYDVSRKTTIAGQPHPVPVAVAEVCRLTWMCAPAPVGPNIHANQAGYGVIARAFAAALRPRSGGP
jgi:lysophospholipase L1-like esterase